MKTPVQEQVIVERLTSETCDTDFCELMKPNVTAMRVTRQTMENTPYVPRVKTTMGEKSIKYRATKCWIDAKPEFKACTKLNQLKRKLRTVWDTFD